MIEAHHKVGEGLRIHARFDESLFLSSSDRLSYQADSPEEEGSYPVFDLRVVKLGKEGEGETPDLRALSELGVEAP